VTKIVLLFGSQLRCSEGRLFQVALHLGEPLLAYRFYYALEVGEQHPANGASRSGHQNRRNKQRTRLSNKDDMRRKWLGLTSLADMEGFEPSVQVLARTTV
jgi:hypothetical protein